MGASKPKAGVTRLGMFAQRWRFDRNPLRRATDRVETVVLALLAAAFLIGTAAGGMLQVWTDRTGDVTTAPLLGSQVAGQTAFGEVLGVLASAGVLALTGALARWRLNRRRMAAWAADWHATGPRWTTRA